MRQNMAFSTKKRNIFWGGGTVLYPDPSPTAVGRGIIPPHAPPPRRLRHLDPSHSKILGTPLQVLICFPFSQRNSVNFGGRRHFCPKTYVWKINKMPKFYTTFAGEILFPNFGGNYKYSFWWINVPVPPSSTHMFLVQFIFPEFSVSATGNYWLFTSFVTHLDQSKKWWISKTESWWRHCSWEYNRQIKSLSVLLVDRTTVSWLSPSGRCFISCTKRIST